MSAMRINKSTNGFGFWMLAAALMLACVLPLGKAIAQYAPEGNAHPTPEVADIGSARNPFGQPGPSSFSTEQKIAFSKQVDVDALRTLALYHSGRIKILDTLSREVVQDMMGRRDYRDLIVDKNDQSKITNVKYDPVFTCLDVMIDPGYYVERPLIHVEFLPLREAILERAYSDKSEIEWWKRVGRLKPAKIAEHLEAVTNKFGLEPGYAKGIAEIRSALLLYQNAWQNLVMVPSTSKTEPWRHVSQLSEDHPVRRAFADLGAAWRAGDVSKTNSAIKVIAAELPKMGQGLYPTTRRSLEAAYNRTHAFEWGYWLYAVALLALLLAFGTSRAWLRTTGIIFLFAAMSMHAFGFVARCIIAERFAIQNQFESMTGVSLFATVVGAALMLVRRQFLFGAAAAGVGFMILLTATQTGIPGVAVEREAPILNTSVLLKYHVTTVLVSYGLISLGFMVALFYLGTHYAAKWRGRGGAVLATSAAGSGGAVAIAGGPGGGLNTGDVSMAAMSASALGMVRQSASSDADTIGGGVAATPTARVLYDLDKAHMIILQLAFWTLGVGILLGAWWADHSWGRWWAFDPKEVWALVTWIVYLVVIHLRFTPLKDRGLTTAWLSVLGFIVMLWCYFGVNLLLPGLHAYA